MRRSVWIGAWTGALLGGALLATLAATGHLPRPGLPSPEKRRALRRNPIVEAVETTRRSVVTILAEGRRPVPDPESELLWFPFAPSRTSEYQWVGSGFFIDADGFILTNEHVVHDARRIMVSVGDATHGMSTLAELVGAAPQFDLALLRVRRDGFEVNGGLAAAEPQFVPARIGDSDDLMVGEWAIAIGSPFGYELGTREPSVSVGVIGAVQRDLPSPVPRQSLGPYLKMIQTDAAINEGNSGGPLVNAAGEVIGVNTVSFASEREGSTGVHFAIPINTARWVGQELRDYGAVRKPWIGWSVAEIAPDVQAKLQVPEDQGVLTVTQVVPESPAARAGIKAGDVLLSIRSMSVYSRERAERILFGTPVDADVEVEILRGGQIQRQVVHVIEDPGTRAEREARARRPAN